VKGILDSENVQNHDGDDDTNEKPKAQRQLFIKNSGWYWSCLEQPYVEMMKSKQHFVLVFHHLSQPQPLLNLRILILRLLSYHPFYKIQEHGYGALRAAVALRRSTNAIMCIVQEDGATYILLATIMRQFNFLVII
jgi:hypothetical protein